MNRNRWRVLYVLICLFFSCSLSSNERYYSQRDSKGVSLDHKLRTLMNYKNGFFIEAGAHAGILQSNTKLLEELDDWRGILVEPSVNLFQELQNNRPSAFCFCCALGSFDEEGAYLWGDFTGSLMSSINGVRQSRPPTEKVLVRSLQSIIDEVGIYHINFLSLDTEGYEFNILKGIDFTKTTFDYMLIEIYPVEYNDIVTFLESKGYDLIANFSNYNRFDNRSWDGTHNDYLFKRRS